MRDFMIDIETLGSAVDSIILSIACVPFTLGKDLPEKTEAFYVGVNIANQPGRLMSADTLRFWVGQPQPVLHAAFSGDEVLPSALKKLGHFISMRRHNDGNRVWANGPSFDIAILEHAYNQPGGGSVPWSYREARDVRTILDLAGVNPKDFTNPAEHDPVADCLHQIRLVNLAHSKLQRI